MKSKRSQWERDRRERLKAEGNVSVQVWVSEDNAALLKALQGDMREKRIVNVIFDGEA